MKKILLLTIIALAVALPVRANIRDSALKGWFTFDSSRLVSNSPDMSGNNNNGRLVLGGSATTTRAGIFYQAIDLDGTNDYMTAGTALGLGSTRYTLSVWFMRDGNGVTSSTGTGGLTGTTAIEPLVMKLVGEGDGSNLDGNYALGIVQATLRLGGDFESTLASNNNNPVIASTTIVNGRWYHAVYTFDGTNNCLYLNGKIDPKCNTSSQTPRSDSIQHFGVGTSLNSSGTSVGAFNGKIDDVMVYNRAFSASEVAQLYNAGLFKRFRTF